MSGLTGGVGALFSPLLTVPLAAAVVLSTTLAVVSWRRRPTAGAVPFTLFSVGVAVWSAVDLLNWLTSGIEASLWLSDLVYVGILLVPAAWFAFALEYANERDVGTRLAVLLAVEPVIVLAVLWTDLGSGLLFTGTRVESVGGYEVVQRSYGPLFWLHAAYSHLLVLTGVGLLIRRFAGSIRLYRYQLLALGLAAAAPWAANLWYLFGLPPFEVVDPTPIGFAVGAVPVFWALVRYRLLKALPGATEAIHESIEEGVAVIDRRDRIVDANATLAELLGESQGAICGRGAADVLPEWDESTGDASARSETRIEIEDRGYFALSVTPITEGGRTTGRVAVLEDVTDRVRRERQLERSRARLEVLDRLLRHDLRNDLNIILGTSELLQESPDDVVDRAATIERTAARLLSHSEKIRHIEWSLYGDEEPRALELAEVVRGGADWLRSMHPEAEVTVDSPSEVWVRATESLPVALRNVLENAVVHNSSPEPRVAVEVTATTEEATIRISDDGPGIPDSELSVLERGVETQLDHLSGVGLWLVEWIVDDADGEIGYETTDGEGSTVRITLAAASPPAPGDRGASGPSGTRRARGSPVDDARNSVAGDPQRWAADRERSATDRSDRSPEFPFASEE